MKKIYSLTLTLVFLILAASHSHAAIKIRISSKDIKSSKNLSLDQVFNGFGCEGKNISPEIVIKSLPGKTKSLAITVHDPDAPTGGSGWWHWIVYDIPPTITKIEAGDKVIAPNVKFGKNDFGTNEYGGACPPKGDSKHRYVFKVHALNVKKLKVSDDASAALIGYNINAHSIGEAQIVPKYGRK